jgi:WD40 repeat protein
MATALRTVQVFISSTFKDMDAERDHLVRRVFPALRERMLARNLNLVDVDLRWGVSESDDALAACEEIIDECRPRFLCILGERYGCVPPGASESITESEIRYAVLDHSGGHDHAWFFFRDEAVTEAMEESWPGEFHEPEDSPNRDRLVELKRAITEAGLSPRVYSARWDSATRRLVDLAAFGEAVAECIWSSVVAKDGLEADDTPPTDDLASFTIGRADSFFLGSRARILQELTDFTVEPDGRYLCLSGESGSGKSSLLAYLVQQLPDLVRPDTTSIAHFVGATARSSSTLETVRRLSQQLIAASMIDVTVPDDLEQLLLEFPRILSKVCAVTDVTIVLDAIDELDRVSRDRAYSWLPAELPDNATIVLSSRPGPALETLRRRLRRLDDLPLARLTGEDADGIIDLFSQRYKKRIAPADVAALKAKSSAGVPLYLRVALEELRTLSTYETIGSRIAELPGDIPALFDWLLTRLEADDEFRDATGVEIGRSLVSTCARLIGVSGGGLAERELAELISPGDRQGNVAALLRLLRPYLFLRNGLLDFAHRQIRAAVDTRYFTTHAERTAAHQALVDYFGAQPAWEPADSVRSKQLPNIRRASVLSDQVLATGNADAVAGLLTDLDFIDAKSAAKLVPELLLDYTNALDSDIPLTTTQRATIQEFARFVRKEGHILTAAPWLAAQRAASQPADLANSVVAAGMRNYRPWLRKIAATDAGAAMMTFGSGGRPLRCCAVSPDGRQAVSGDASGVLRSWEMATGQVVATSAAHAGAINRCRWSPDGRLFATVADDHAVQIWDPASWTSVAQLTMHDKPVLDCAFSPDGRALYSCTEDSVLVVDPSTGIYGPAIPRVKGLAYSELSVPEAAGLVRHETSLRSVAISPDGRTIVTTSCWVGTVKLWNVKSGRLKHTLGGAPDQVSFHGDAVYDADFDPEGTTLAVARQGTLELWDLRGSPRRRTAVEGSILTAIRVCSFSPDGQLVALASDDGAIQIVEAQTGAIRAVWSGHREGALDVAWTRDGDAVLSCSLDGYAKLWALTQPVARRPSRAERLWVIARSDAGTVAARPDADEGGSPVVILDAETGTESVRLGSPRSPQHHLPPRQPRSRTVHGAAFSPDARRLAVTGDSTVDLWDTENGSHVATFTGRVRPQSCCEFSPDGTRLITRSQGSSTVAEIERSELILWDVPSASVIGTLAAPFNGESFARELMWFTPDGASIVAGTPGPQLRVWDAVTGREQLVMAWPAKTRLGSCSLAPDGAHVLVFLRGLTLRGLLRRKRDKQWRSPEQMTQVRSVSTGEVCAEWSAHDDNDGKHCYSPDGATVVTWETFGEPDLLAWDPRTGAHLGTVGRATARVADIVFAPDGGRLVCALEGWSADGSSRSTFFDHAVELWDPHTGRRLGAAPGKFHGFSPDGRMLLVVHQGALSILSSAGFDEVMRFIDDIPVQGAEWSRRGDTIRVRQPTDPKWFHSADTLGDHNSVLRLENWEIGPPVVTAWARPDTEQPHPAGGTAFRCPNCLTWNNVAPSDLGGRTTCSNCGRDATLNSFTLGVDWQRLANPARG